MLTSKTSQFTPLSLLVIVTDSSLPEYENGWKRIKVLLMPMDGLAYLHGNYPASVGIANHQEWQLCLASENDRKLTWLRNWQ